MTRYKKLILVAAVAIFSFSAGLYPGVADARTGRKGEKSRQSAKETKKAPDPKETGEDDEQTGEKTAQKAGTRGEEKVGSTEPEKNANEDLSLKEYRDEDFKPKVEEESSVWLFIKMMLLLGLFGGGFYYFYRFVTKKTGMNLFGGEAIKVLSVVPLGQNKFLQVVDMAGKILVLGVADSNINLISEITDKDQADRIRILSNRTPPPDTGHGGFNDYFSRQIGRVLDRIQEFKRRDRKIRATAVERPADVEYLRLQRSRLKNLNGNPDE